VALTLYGFPNHPQSFAVTKTNAPLDQCVFFLDFSRPLKRIRWLLGINKWVGVTVGLMVPIVHLGEEEGGYVFGVNRGEPYFADLLKLWKENYRVRRSFPVAPVDGLRVIADFATHFPQDC
jgi:hypothetical protein